MSRGDYRRLNVALALALLLLAATPRALTVSPDGARLLLPGGAAVPELCLTKRTTGRECGSCHLGRSVVLAAQGDLDRSTDHHRGGVLLLGWVALQALVRILLALTAVSIGRFWWIDLTVTLGSLAAAAGVAAIL